MEEIKLDYYANYQRSAFEANGIDYEINILKEQVKKLYLSDNIPWVIGYSGGKDSTATTQLVWQSIKELQGEQRTKPIFVISTDTLVENPVVAMWVGFSLEKMTLEAKDQNMPIRPNRLTPELKDRFWVNLIGKGYPAPRPRFRWCTSRLKINPANTFIMDIVDQNGEAILVLGTRKAESNARKKVMNNHEGSTRDLLSRNGNAQLDRVWVYPPIGHWTNDDVWEYLTTYPNPWGFENKELLKMYRGATQDNECPLVVDTSTPSCGDSRFGCFVCTLVDKDKSMQAMIKNDEEKRWMLPLSEFRDKYLDTKNDFYKRDFRRMDGRLQLMDDVVTGKKKLVHGPYLQSYREKLLTELLKAQELVRSSGGVTSIELFEVITNEELEEIRRIWVKDKNEIEDRVPQIFTSVTGEPYPFPKIDEGQIFKPENLELLKEVIDKNRSADNLHYQLVRNLLNIERNFSTATRRVGIYEELEKVITNSGFDNEEDALNFALSRISDEDISNNIETVSEIATEGAMFELINDDEVQGESLNRSQS